MGLEGDLLDAVVLGPRLRRGERVTVQVFAAVGLTDHGMYDDKLICAHSSISPWQQFYVLLFFRFYSKCKGILNVFRDMPGRNACTGLIEPDTLIRDNNNQLLRCQNGTETNIQTIF